MMRFVSLTALSKEQVAQYRTSMREAYPSFIHQSKIVEKYWPLMEEYMPDLQLFMLDEQDVLVGYMNTVALFWDQDLDQLPDAGWDWLIQKAVSDYRENKTPNCLGGLQIIVTKNNLGKGYSKLLIEQAKKIRRDFEFKHVIIPIRPTFKSKHPYMPMEEYISYQQDGRIYDPWIRTHVNSGAEVIKICHQSMRVVESLDYWSNILSKPIEKAEAFHVHGALNPVLVKLETKEGIYNEENVWICYK